MQNRNRSPQSSTKKPRQNAMSGVPIREEPPAEAYNYDPVPYDAYEAYPPPQKGGGVRTALLIVLAILLVAGGALGAYMVLSMKDEDTTTAREEPQTVVEEQTAVSETEQAPSPQDTAVALLEQMQYVGSAQGCVMSPQQATSFANTIRATQGNVVYAAIFDGGNGVPILWVAKGGALEDVSGYTAVLINGYGDKLYSCASGQSRELPWMTTLLRAGTDGVMVKTTKDTSKLQFFYLHNGTPDASPYGVALWSVGGGGSYNGTYLGPAEEVGPAEFYRQAGTDGTILLEAITGLSDSLMLTGPWISGAQMASLLDQYAAALS